MIREFSVNKTKTNKKVQKFFQRPAQKMFRTTDIPAGLEFWNRNGPAVYRYRFHLCLTHPEFIICVTMISTTAHRPMLIDTSLESLGSEYEMFLFKFLL